MLKSRGLVLFLGVFVAGHALASGQTRTGKFDTGEKISCVSTDDANSKFSCEVTGHEVQCSYRSKNRRPYFDGTSGCTFSGDRACFVIKDVVCRNPDTGDVWVDRTEAVFLGCFDNARDCQNAG